MVRPWTRLVVGFVLLTGAISGQCAKDHRETKKDGILVTDFAVTGTQTLSVTELAGMTGNFVGNCYTDDSEEMGERVRGLFQDKGYLLVEVKSLKFKPSDPLASPKPVAMEAEVTEGLRYKTGEISFEENRAFTTERLRSEFPLKRGNTFERGRVATGLESLRKIYEKNGYLDFMCIPDTTPSSNGTVDLKITIQEGPQYRLEKVEFIGKKETVARPQVQWKLAEGSVYDQTYLDRYIETNREFLPEGFNRNDVQIATDCPRALVDIRLVLDDSERAVPMKSVPCEQGSKKQ